MDLDARGRPDLGYYFCERYHARADDPQLFALLPFYRCYRAYVRGKVLSFRLDEPELSQAEQDKAAARARHYFELARRYAAPLTQPTVIVVAGSSGTEKTSVARAIAGELGLRVISSDAVRASLFGEAKQPADYGAGVYSKAATRRTYQQLLAAAQALLKADGGVILDATFLQESERKMAREMAASAGARWRLIECRLPDDLVEQRLRQRAERKDGLSDATWEIYLAQSKERPAVACVGNPAHLALDTSGKLSAAGQAAADWLRAKDHDRDHQAAKSRR
jgi:predicted kinase